MANLTRIQTLLRAAAQRPDGAILPLPDGAKLHRATARSMLTKGLVVYGAHGAQQAGEAEHGLGEGLSITAAGREWIGTGQPAMTDAPATTEAPAMSSAEAPAPLRPAGKAAEVLALLSRAEGASLAELVAATGWQPHTTRAALTRLRQAGHSIRLAAEGDRRAYHLGAEA